MTAAMRPRNARSIRIGVLAGIVVCALALVGAAVVGSHPSPDGSASNATARQQQATLISWEADVHPLVVAAGQVVALGPRQGVSEVANRTKPADQLHRMAAGWHGRLVALTAQLAATPTPNFLARAHALLNRAMTGYVDATKSLLAATTARGLRRTSLLAAATAAGKTSDRIYDDAVAAIAQWRSRLGLAPDWSGS